TTQNNERVREAVIRSPHRSARKQAAALGISDRSVRRILHLDLHYCFFPSVIIIIIIIIIIILHKIISVLILSLFLQTPIMSLRIIGCIKIRLLMIWSPCSSSFIILCSRMYRTFAERGGIA
ncbi:hypothetical protein C0J52_15751, partial [Blattella germanica]